MLAYQNWSIFQGLPGRRAITINGPTSGNSNANNPQLMNASVDNSRRRKYWIARVSIPNRHITKKARIVTDESNIATKQEPGNLLVKITPVKYFNNLLRLYKIF